MHRPGFSLVVFVSLGVALATACGAEPIDVPDDDGDDNGGTGATQGSGGSFGGTPAAGGTFGGTPATGGTFGGTPSTGGTFGGTPATGGTFAGTPSTGGTPATGGTFPTGGTAGSGVSGSVATGGVAGTTATGGSAGTGPATCGATFEAGADGFVRAPGTTGCWNGYASAGGDVGTMVMPTTFAMCGMGCMLRTSGMLGAANAANSYAGYAFLGFNVNQPSGSTTFSTIAPTGTSLVITYTKAAGPATIRVQLQGGATRWCANLTASPASIPYAMFNTACWDNSGTAYTKQPIDAVQLVAPGGEAAQAIDMTLVSVKDT